MARTVRVASRARSVRSGPERPGRRPRPRPTPADPGESCSSRRAGRSTNHESGVQSNVLRPASRPTFDLGEEQPNGLDALLANRLVDRAETRLDEACQVDVVEPDDA